MEAPALCGVHGFARGNENTLHACAEFRTLGLGLSCGLELRKASVIHRVRTRNLDQHVTAEQGSSPGNMLGCVNTSKMVRIPTPSLLALSWKNLGPFALGRTETSIKFFKKLYFSV